ncbi:subtype I-B CRISPR-associated endonuclease Cas1 [Candidatus Geothermarchaeota archaeon]|nr:MAG: subtype I-B CRISPR-associated endonuclease Cas1 [Candidatus Geothermarchaeota archaeon]
MKKKIFIFSSGKLKREANTLCFSAKNSKKFIPVSEVSSILIFGEVSFNKRLLEFLSSNEITLHLFNYYGFYVGSFYPRTHYNSGYMTVKQCEHYLDKCKRINLARKFVEGALKNMIKNLKYYDNRGMELSDQINLLETSLLKLNNINTVESLMALEGNAKKEYYRSFNKILKNKDFIFERREKRPPKNRINTLLSFGNSMIYVTVLSEIYKTHLDPRIGFLHTSNFRSFSLNLDVAEVFKPIIVDRLIIRLVNKNMLDSSCFIKELDGLFLSTKGKKIFIKNYEDKLRQTIRLGRFRKISYQRLIRLELYKIEKHLIGEKEYQPYVSRW